jgi:hypothetical protein
VSETGGLRKVSFTPAASATAALEISAIGVSSDEALTIRAINGESCAKTPKIELKQGERINLEIEFETSYLGPISLVLTSVAGVADAH